MRICKLPCSILILFSEEDCKRPSGMQIMLRSALNMSSIRIIPLHFLLYI